MIARLLLAAVASGIPATATATWSIVAVDPETREVGLAAASCISGVEITAGLVPGRGVIAAQALVSPRGRDRAVELLGAGASPTEVIEVLSDAEYDRWSLPLYRLRQYGVAALGQRAGAFTGEWVTDWKGDAQNGSGTVSAQGNMLYGGAVLRDALAAFGASAGSPLAERLLLALEAGAAAGGDSRCSRAQTALSAVLIVARPDDPAGRPSLRLRFPETEPPGFAAIAWEQVVQFMKRQGNGFADAPLAPDEENPVVRLRRRYDLEAGRER